MFVATLLWVLLGSRRLGLIWFPIEAALIFWIWRHTLDALGNLNAEKKRRVIEKRMRRDGFGPYRD